MIWHNNDSIYYHISTLDRNKIAAFDFDHTIVKPKKTIHPRNSEDWVYCYSNVKEKLNKLWKEGYCITFFSNQRVLEVSPRRDMILERFNNVLKDLDIPINVILSYKDDQYRKPNMGMFLFLNNQINIDIENSFYVGDAAGRVFSSERKRDFSSADRYFAINNGLNFSIPEDFFDQICDEYYFMDELPFNQIKQLKPFHQFNGVTTLDNGEKEMIIFVGYPSSGKTLFYNKYLSSYKRNPRKYDNCKIVIDANNNTRKTREKFINKAKENNLNVRCFYFNIDMTISKHLNNYRMLTEYIPKYKDVVFYTYRKYFEMPELNEGFKEIVHINFAPIFDDKKCEKLFYKYS